MASTHLSPFQGTWYPAKAPELDVLLDSRFAQSRQRAAWLPAGGIAYVVPHAGPEYSGTVAAAVYRAIEARRPERIVLLGLSHSAALNGVYAPEVETIGTPLGEVHMDQTFGGFPRIEESCVCDHSVEIQLPFLQRVAPEARITALYVGRMDGAARRSAAARLAAAWHEGVVLIASSDFTHYGPRFHFVPFPFSDVVGEELREMDSQAIDAAACLDADYFLERLRETRATVCGTGPICLLMETLKRIETSTLYLDRLDYQTSGEITGDYRNSVSYAALGFFERKAYDAGDKDRAALLASACSTLRNLREEGTRVPIAARGSLALQARRAAFVSLHSGNQLLGCIGTLVGREPLSEEIPRLTLAAALDDPRFSPAAGVRGPIDVEISLLTPFRRITDLAAFEAGRHGACLRMGDRAGLLLPQVATEFGWDRDQFFAALSRKAGLGTQAWRDPKARIEIFEAQILSTHSATASSCGA
jgi:MEMO1 family protein